MMQLPIMGEEVVNYRVEGKLCDMEMGADGPGFSGYDYLHNASGKPKLPAILRTFLLPYDTELSSISVTMENADEKVISASGPIARAVPYQTAMGPIECEVDDRAAADIYPKLALVNTVARLGNCVLVTAEINPYRQDTVDSTLTELASGDLKIKYEVGAAVEKNSVVPWIDKQLKRIIVNYDDMIGSYSLLPAADKPHLAIITTDAIVAGSQSLEKFIAAKEQKGFKVSLVTEGEWGGAADRADGIRNWLKQNYEAQQIEYALLIGDPIPTSGDVPMKMTLPMATPIGSDCPTDYYFAELSGDWDMNKNGWFGEGQLDLVRGGPDKYAEVAVGRIPVYDGDFTALDKILDKTIAYGNAASAEVEARKNMLIISEPSDPFTPSYEFGELIQKEYIEPSDWSSARIYKESYGDVVPDFSPTSIPLVTEVWNSKSFGLCTWQTHGNEDIAKKIMHSDSVTNLNEKSTSLIFQGSCLNAKPEVKNNLAYSLLQRGAIGTIGATRLSLYLSGQTNPKDKKPTNLSLCYYFARFALHDKEPIGVVLNRLKSEVDGDFFGAWLNYCDYNVYGDPTLSVYDGKDQAVALENSAFTPVTSADILRTSGGITVNLTSPVQHGSVHLFGLNGREIYSQQFSNEKSVNISRSAAAPGVYLLVLNLENRRITQRVALK